MSSRSWIVLVEGSKSFRGHKVKDIIHLLEFLNFILCKSRFVERFLTYVPSNFQILVYVVFHVIFFTSCLSKKKMHSDSSFLHFMSERGLYEILLIELHLVQLFWIVCNSVWIASMQKWETGVNTKWSQASQLTAS